MEAQAGLDRSSGRVEDFRLVRGEGRFGDDLRLPDKCHAVFVRSPHAHARILDIDRAAARAGPGVLAVYDNMDMERAGIGNVSIPPPMEGRGGKKLVVPFRPALAHQRVLHVGQPVLMVVAEATAAATDAAGLVAIDYEPLPSVRDTEAAVLQGAPQLWPEAPDNIAIDWPGPVPDPENETEVAHILESAPHRVSIRVANRRIAGVPLEPRGATATFDPASGRYTLHCGSQGAGALRDQVAKVMGIDARALRVLSDDVGGGFGLKMAVYPEYPALLAAARLLGRPVHWMSDRSESFMSDQHARDQVAIAELALDSEGHFLALKVDAISNMGAFLATNGAIIATNNFARCFPTVYRIEKIALAHRCVFTNTVSTGPYRGAGRPEANFLMERLVQAAARQTGIDAIELRRLNFVPHEVMPHATAVGTTIDSGEFDSIFDRALSIARHNSFGDRRTAAAELGKLRGIGVSSFLEHAGAVGTESANLSFLKDGTLTLSLGVHSNGQGHASVFRDLLARLLGIDVRHIVVRQGDSDFELKGMPAVASRSAMTVSAAMQSAVDRLVGKGRRIAAAHLEAAEADMTYRGGTFEVAGTDRRVSLFDLAELAAGMKARGELSETLDTRATTDVPQSFPNGCHIAEVEIDPETGAVEIVNYVAVDDCGNVLDHRTVEGQVVGSLAQGIGQALIERVVYDDPSGQILTASFNDYAMPRAADMPPITAAEHPVPCRTNPLGVKGVGEAGTTAAIAAVMNAIGDAIPNDRGWEIDMPATPEKVWRACRGEAPDLEYPKLQIS